MNLIFNDVYKTLRVNVTKLHVRTVLTEVDSAVSARFRAVIQRPRGVLSWQLKAHPRLADGDRLAVHYFTLQAIFWNVLDTCAYEYALSFKYQEHVIDSKWYSLLSTQVHVHTP